MLNEDEAVTLAGLLEELAAHHQHDPLSAPALRAATLLRQRVAAGHGVRLEPSGPAARREAGDFRDDRADDRDAQAGQRDRHADERDDRAIERHRLANDADQEAEASERRVSDVLWDAELVDKSAAEHAVVPPPAADDAMWQQRQLDGEVAEADQTRARQGRRAIREVISQARAARQAALRGRFTDSRDRLASNEDRHAARADRQDAARDRQTSRADRDQSVIESEQEGPLPRH